LEQQPKPILFLLSGPPGAGKSTNASIFLPDKMKGAEVFDRDKVRQQTEAKYRAEGTTPTPGRDAAQASAEALNNHVSTHLQQGSSFALETQIHDPDVWRKACTVKDKGYELHMAYVGLASDKLSVDRVKKRIEAGGHPYATIKDAKLCFAANLAQLDLAYNHSELDRLEIYDNSAASSPRELLTMKRVRSSPPYR
jgi:predicted ABC-type ATPase